MYIVAWHEPTTHGTKQRFEIVDGEDAMQIFVSDLVARKINEDDITVGSIID
jgi:hypothetical protein